MKTSHNSVSQPPVSIQELYGDQFRIAVTQAAEIMNRPEYNGRLTRAMDLVLGGHVTLHDDDTATVKSGSHTYHIEDACDCQFAQ